MSKEVINPYQTFYDDDGIPLANGTISFLVNTTTTLGTIFSDEALTVAQANPYTLDAHGRIAADVKYSGFRTLLIKTALGGTVRTIDNISTSNDSVSDLSQSHIFDTVAEYKAFTTAFPIGKKITTLEFSTGNSGGACYTIIASGTENTRNIIKNTDLSQSISLIISNEKFSSQWGANSSLTAAQNTVIIQAMIDVNTTGGVIKIEKDIKFNMLGLDLTVNECFLDYFGNDQADNPSFQEPGTNEQILFSNNWKQDGGGTTDVNEWRFESPHHPGVLLNAKNEVSASGTAPPNGKASVIFLKNGFNQYQIGQNESASDVNYYALQSYEIRLSFVIGTDDFTVNPIVGDIVVGDASGARSIVLSITATTMLTSWLKGTYTATETVTADGTKTSTSTVGTLPVHSQNNKPFRLVQNMTGGQGANTTPERALSSWHIGGALTIEDAQGGGLGSVASSITVYDDIETPTIGWKLDKNPTTGELRHLDAAGAEIGTAIRGDFTTSVTLADAVTAGNEVTPSQSNFYQRTIEGVCHFTIGLLNINTAGLTAGNQIFVRNLEKTIKNLPNAQPNFQVKGAGITSTTGSIAAEGIANTTVMKLYQNLTTGSAILTVAAIASGSGDLFISGSYIEE